MPDEKRNPNDDKVEAQEYFEKVHAKISVISDSNLRSALFDLLYGDADKRHPEHPKFSSE